jgi:hypothetical protein
MIYLSNTNPVACGLTGNSFKVITINTLIPSGVSFSLQFTNIRNPLSFAPLNNIQVTSKTPNDIYLYSRSFSTNSLANLIPTQFNSISYTYAPQQLDSSLSLTLRF